MLHSDDLEMTVLHKLNGDGRFVTQYTLTHALSGELWKSEMLDSNIAEEICKAKLLEFVVTEEEAEEILSHAEEVHSTQAD